MFTKLVKFGVSTVVLKNWFLVVLIMMPQTPKFLKHLLPIISPRNMDQTENIVN